MTHYTIIGCGNVGASIAFGLVLTKDNFELDLIDIDRIKLAGEIADLKQACEVMHKNIRIESVEEPRKSDCYIITAGKAGIDRNILYEENSKIILPLIKTIAKVNGEDSWVLMVTNPSHRLAQLALEHIPRIIPIGNKLDNARLRLSKVTASHENPEIQSQYHEVIMNKGYTNWATACEVLDYIRD